MAASKKRERVHRPSVLRKGDDILLVLEHTDLRQRALYADNLKLFEEVPRDIDAKFSVTSKGFAFYNKVEVGLDRRGEVAVQGESNIMWRHYSLRVEF